MPTKASQTALACWALVWFGRSGASRVLTKLAYVLCSLPVSSVHVLPVSAVVRNGVTLGGPAGRWRRSASLSLPRAALRQIVSMITLWSVWMARGAQVATPRAAPAW